jgi:hypothetical protein
MRSEPPTAFTQMPQHSPAEEKLYDPLPLCIYTTIGIIAWLITPPLTVAIFGTLGVIGYRLPRCGRRRRVGGHRLPAVSVGELRPPLRGMKKPPLRRR